MQPLLADIAVNGETIAATAIAAEAQNHPAPKSRPGEAWQAAARALAIRALLLQEARRRGLRPDPQEIGEGLAETDDEALIRQVLDEAVDPPPPSDAEVRAAHAASPGRWRAPTLYEAAHILLPVPPGDVTARAAAWDEAAALIEKLRERPRDFGRLARAHSACPSRDAEGRLGQLTTGDTVPEFEAALEALDQGALCDTPVETRYGVHIIRLDARAPGEVLPYEAAAPMVRDMIAKRAWARAVRAFTAGLVARAEIDGITFQAA